MPVIRLLNTYSITFFRSEAGYTDRAGDYIDSGVAPTQIPTSGSLQPLSPFNAIQVLPEGTKTSDSKIYFSKDQLRTVEQYSDEEADYCLIDNLRYTVFRKEPWEVFNLTPDHNVYILLRDNPRGTNP